MTTAPLIDEMVVPTESVCPCCHERPAVPGLFARVKIADFPAAMGLVVTKEPMSRVLPLSEDVMEMFGRYFCRAFAGMPLSRLDSPIRFTTWIEVDQATANCLLEASNGISGPLSAAGRLAVDLPGFPGSLGAEVEFQASEGDSAVLIGCEDRRLRNIPHDLDHDGMAALYRKVWGNSGPVIDADLGLRAAVNRHWHRHIGRPFYRRAVTPPASIAGIRPPEMLISPPLDTNEPARLATVGASEHPDSSGELIELITELRNPTEECIDAFGVFSWFSRVSPGPFSFETAILNSQGIPGAAEGMIGWLLWIPRLLPEEGCSFEHAGKRVRILEAIPVFHDEVAFMQLEGAEALASILESADTSDLQRASVSPLAD